METNDSNIKPQQTGGLKLMTVFIAVLALHVVVIGGFTVYHLMSGGSTDADLLTDKTHKTVKVTPDGAVAGDGQMPDAGQPDKSATTSTAPTETAGAPMTIPAPVVEPHVASDNSTPTTTTAPSQSGPVIHPPADLAPTTTLASGPVKMPTTSSTATSVTGVPYLVKSHDSLAKIARQHHTTVAKLKAANSLNSDMLHIGQKLLIPSKTQVASTAVIPDSLDSTNLGDVAAVPSLETPATATVKSVASTAQDLSTTASPAVSHHTYTVVKGDTLVKIARKFKTTATAIMAENKITDATKLGIGKKLKIPTAESRSATNTPPETAPPSQGQAKSGATAQLANFVP